jgi:hypothetical protein
MVGIEASAAATCNTVPRRHQATGYVHFRANDLMSPADSMAMSTSSDSILNLPAIAGDPVR